MTIFGLLREILLRPPTRIYQIAGKVHGQWYGWEHTRW